MPQLIIKRSDGGVSLGPIDTTADPANEVRKWQDVHPEVSVVSWRTSPVAVTRPSRHFRDAWTDDLPGNQIDVNMTKARTIHMDRIRKVRDVELRKLDVVFMRAIESGDVAEQKRIGVLKQTLRDIPQTFDLSGATTPAELKALWPSGLPNGS